MKKTILFLGLLVYSAISTASELVKLSDKKLIIYRGNAAIYELRGTANGKTVTLALPDSIDAASLMVETEDKSRILHFEVYQSENQSRRPLQTKQEFLFNNIGKFIELEVIEGKDAIPYEGLIMPLNFGSEVLLLRTDSATTRVIPIENIAHISLENNANISTEFTTYTNTLRITFADDKPSRPLKISVMAKGIHWQPYYAADGIENSKITLYGKIYNQSIEENNLTIVLVDALMPNDLSANSSHEIFAESNDHQLIKDENYTLVAGQFNTNFNYKMQLSEPLQFITNPKTCISQIDTLPIDFYFTNNSLRYLPAGILKIKLGTSDKPYLIKGAAIRETCKVENAIKSCEKFENQTLSISKEELPQVVTNKKKDTKTFKYTYTLLGNTIVTNNQNSEVEIDYIKILASGNTEISVESIEFNGNNYDAETKILQSKINIPAGAKANIKYKMIYSTLLEL